MASPYNDIEQRILPIECISYIGHSDMERRPAENATALLGMSATLNP